MAAFLSRILPKVSLSMEYFVAIFIYWLSSLTRLYFRLQHLFSLNYVGLWLANISLGITRSQLVIIKTLVIMFRPCHIFAFTIMWNARQLFPSLFVLVWVFQADVWTVEEPVRPSCPTRSHRWGGRQQLSSPSDIFRGGMHDERLRSALEMRDWITQYCEESCLNLFIYLSEKVRTRTDCSTCFKDGWRIYHGQGSYQVSLWTGRMLIYLAVHNSHFNVFIWWA